MDYFLDYHVKLNSTLILSIDNRLKVEHFLNFEDFVKLGSIIIADLSIKIYHF